MTTPEMILRNTSATLSITFSAGAADDGVTVTITGEDGTALVTDAATTHTGSGTYTYQLAPQENLNVLTVAWTGTFGGTEQTLETAAEIVGGMLFTIAEARAFDDAALNDTTKYPDAAIREVRDGITDLIQHVCGVSPIPRYARETLDGPGSADLWLTRLEIRTLLAASVNGTALTQDEVDAVAVYPYGRLHRSTGSWDTYTWGSTGRRTVTVAYEHGYQRVPWDIHQAALTLTRYVLVSTDISDRTISWSNELGTFRQAVPGAKYPTGIPTVDAALARHTVTGTGMA